MVEFRMGRREGKLLVALLACGLVTAACSSSSSPGSSTGSASGGVAASAKQTIVFAESGLGTEGQFTQQSISDFEKLHPNITVNIQVLSPASTTYTQQLEDDFISGSPTPDVLESDVTYPAKFAKAGWMKNLTTTFHPDMSPYFSSEVAAGTYKGGTYAIPWFANPEGLFYRTDLVPTPPTSPAQVVTDAEAAMKADPNLKEGIAFEGNKYEGAVTMFLTLEGAFGGKLDPSNLDTPANLKALTYLHDLLYQSKVAPTAVIGWEEGQVEQEFVAGHTAFAIDYPFVYPLAEAAGAPTAGHVGFIPFPAAKGGQPGSALGGEMLAINSKSTHYQASWELIQYLTSQSVETARAIATGDPPSEPGYYTSALYAKAPQFKFVKTLNSYAQPRPVNPNYLSISSDLQTMLSDVIANLSTPKAALSSTATQVKTLAGSTNAGG